MGHTSKFVNSVPLQLWPNANRWKASNLWKYGQVLEGLPPLVGRSKILFDDFDLIFYPDFGA